MKRFALLLGICLASIQVLSSCEPETLLTVDQTSLSVGDSGGSQSVSLTANKPWSASSDQAWCKVSPTGGEEATSSKITITCDANTSYDARTATVTFTCAELTKTVSVSQATNNGLMVSKTEYDISNAAQQVNIEVKANVKFSVEVDNACKSWVKYNTTKGLTTSTVVLDIAENKDYDEREGKVTIKQDGGNLSSTITIKQSQQNGLFLTTSEYSLSNEQHTLTVEVKSNIDFEVKSEVDWIKYVETKGLMTNQIILDVSANDTYDAREGKVTVKQKNGDLSGTITIKQDEKYGLLVSQSEYSLTNEAQTIDVEVKYNVDLEVVIPDGCKAWIKQVSTKALDSKTYTFSIAKNETYGNREGSITFKQKKGDLSATVAIKQDGRIKDQIALEKEALIDLYNATDGRHWRNNTNWCSDLPVGQWSGVWTDSRGLVYRLQLSANGLNGTIPESIGNLVNLTYLHLGNNYEISGSIPESICNLVNLKVLMLAENKLTGTIPDAIKNLTQLEDFSIYLNRLDGILSEDLYYSDWWISRYFRMDQHEGYGLKFENIYESTDFSQDGVVKTIQKHTKGPGGKIVITADGFSDRMIADGYFDKMVNMAVDAFFSEEPYHTFRDYFDVYSVVAVSKNELIAYDLAFETTFSDWGPSDGIKANYEKVNEYISKAPGVKDFLSSTVGLLLVNKNNGCAAPVTFMYDNNYALAVVGAGDGDYVKHEAGGHGYGKLADEYYHDRPYTGNLHEEYHQRGWYLNVDDTDDPTQVLWKDFLNDPYYQNEGIGIYQGALYNNWYKSTSNSIMQNGIDGFNPPSRWAIYKRIKKLAGEEYSFEDFLASDKKRTKNFVERQPSRMDRINKENPLMIIHSPF